MASCCRVPAARGRASSSGLVDDLQVEDDSASLHLPGFDSAVQDADGLRKGGHVVAGGKPTGVGEGGRHWV